MVTQLIVAPEAVISDEPIDDRTGGVVSGKMLLTVTGTGALVVVLPCPSRATAVMVCGPLLEEVVSQVRE